MIPFSQNTMLGMDGKVDRPLFEVRQLSLVLDPLLKS